MGNSISFKEIRGEYIATIKKQISTKLGHASIFEFGDLDKLRKHYAVKQIRLDICVYEKKKKKRIYDLTYENLRKRKIIFVIKSNSKEILNKVVTQILKLIKWTPLKSFKDKHIFSPRTVMILSKTQYSQLSGRRNNGLRLLASTERQANTKIVYLKKKQVLIVSSNAKSANHRIIKKIKNIKNNRANVL